MTDYALGTTIYLAFTTRSFSTGVPTQLAGSPVLSVLEENNATPITSGVSVSVDRASVTGLNEATIVASSGNGFEAGKEYALYISTGTVGGVSVVGEVVGRFTIEKASALRPTTAGRTFDVSATGEGGVDWANVGSPTTAVNLSATNIDVDQVVASVSGAVGSVTGAVGSVTGNVGGNVTGTVGSVVGAVGSVTGNVGGNVTGSVGSVVGAVGSVTGAVGSVTGNVGGNVVGSVASVTAGVTVTTNNDKTGYRLSATGVDDILDEVTDGAVTLRQGTRLWNSALGAKVSGMDLGAPEFRDLADSKDRITATTDADGNRTAVTLDLT